MSWNAQEDLRVCLHSIGVGTVCPETVETWVVDNDSADGSGDMVAREFPNVHLIRRPTNEGFSGGNNHMLRDLDADYALLLNSDALCHPGSLDTLLDWADAHPRAGIMGPKVLNTDGSLQYSCRRFPTFAAGLFRNVYLGRLFPNNKPAADYLMQDFDHNSVKEVDWVSGCVLLMRRTCIDEIGLLDAETFFMYCEDMDWCLRAHDAKWGITYVPDAVFTHAIGKSSNHAAERMIIAHHRSMWLFYKKHQAFFDREMPLPLRPLVPVGIFLRVVVRIGRRRYINPLLNLLRGKKQQTTSEQNVQQTRSTQ